MDISACKQVVSQCAKLAKNIRILGNDNLTNGVLEVLDRTTKLVAVEVQKMDANQLCNYVIGLINFPANQAYNEIERDRDRRDRKYLQEVE